MSAWVVPGYTEQRELGRGASGRVVAAVHEASGQPVAIKYLAPKLFRDPDFLDGFRREAEVLRSLDVPHVVRLYDYVEEPGQGAAIVMELVNGVSLHEMITREGATSPEAALVVLKGSLLGLGSAHALGIVHRDYKPENVLVDGEGESKLTDFGVAVKAGRKVPTAGTPLYMAPEQWAGAPATPASDIYAASAVLFECLTSKTPFSGRIGQLAMQHETAAVPIEQVDEPLRGLIARGMAKDPTDRPTNAMDFVAELDSVADSVYGEDWEERGRSHLKERAAALLLLLLLGAAAGTTGGSWAATLLGSLRRHRRTAIAGAAAGIIAAVAVTTTTLALQGSNTLVASPTASHGVGTSGTGGSTPGGSTPGGGSPSISPTPTASSSTGKPTTKPSAGGTTPIGTGATGTPTSGTPSTTPTSTKPTSTPAQTPTPTPVLTVSVLSPTPVTGACPSTLPTLTATGTIGSNLATTVTYKWVRSNGTSSGPATVHVSAGGSASVSDSVTAASNNWEIADTLQVTSPVTASRSTKLDVACSYPTLTIASPGSQFPTVDFPIQPLAIQAGGGSGPYKFSASNLPPGLSISAGGVISGTPTTIGRYNVTVSVTDTEALPQSASTTFLIDVISQIA